MPQQITYLGKRPLDDAAQQTPPQTPLLTPPPDDRNWAQRKLDAFTGFLRELPTPFKQSPLGMMVDVSKNVVTDTIDALSHPIENAPALAAELASLHPAVRGVRAVVYPAAAAAAGSFVKNRARAASGQPMQSIDEAALEVGLTGVAPQMAAPAARRVARGADKAADALTAARLRPVPSVLDDVVNPATGKPFLTEAEQSAHLARTARTRVSGRPGSQAFAADAAAKGDALRAQKVAALDEAQAHGVTFDRDTLTPPPMDPRVTDIATRTGLGVGADDALKKLQATADELFADFEVVPHTAAGGNLPVMQPRASKPYTPREVDVKLRKIDEALERFYAERNALNAKGVQVKPEADEAWLAEVRKTIKSAMEAMIPEIVEPNRQMAELIPVEKAAVQAAKPFWRQEASIAVGSSGRPSFFGHPLGVAGSFAIRPTEAISRFFEQNASRFPHLMRFLMLTNDEPEGLRPPPR